MMQTYSGSNEKRQPTRAGGALALTLVLMLAGYAMAKSPQSLAGVKDPFLGTGSRVTYQGPWTVVDNQEKDTIRIYDEVGNLANLIDLVGQEHIGTVSSVDNAG